MLGLVTENLYAVVAWISDDEKHMSVIGYYLNDPKSSNEWEELSAAIAEVSADYGDGFVIDEERFVDVRAEPIPLEHHEHLMFLRQEPS